MGCFLSSKKERTNNTKFYWFRRDHHAQRPSHFLDFQEGSPSSTSEDESSTEGSNSPCDPRKVRAFTFATLAAATRNFKNENFIGKGQVGAVYKGHLQDTGEIVAIKQLDHNGCQGISEFMVDFWVINMLDHPNVVKLRGYCAEGDRRLSVFEYMPLGSLEDHLHGPSKRPLDWNTRIKIAVGVAQGLEYLHDNMKLPIIYRNLKSSNILLGEGFHPKLSDFGLAKLCPSGDQIHVSTRVIGTFGYFAPEYALTGQLTFKSDIYSFGVVLLEIITGRLAFDKRRSGREINLAEWARPLLNDENKFRQMADPALNGQYPVRGLYQALTVAIMCVQEEPNMRPVIADIVKALSYLASQAYDPDIRGNQTSVEAPVLKDLDDNKNQVEALRL